MLHKKSSALEGNTTPNIEKSEGVRPAIAYVPAGYLKLVRYDKRVDEWKVISYGKVVAPDSNNMLVPAGLAIDIETAVAGEYANKAAFIAAAANFGEVYTQYDVDNGIVNFAGDAVTLNEPVVASFFEAYAATGTLNNAVGAPIGLAQYDYWKQHGAGYTDNPLNYTNEIWNVQDKVGILTRYHIELPVVSDYSTVSLPGIMVFEGSVKPGDLVTFNNKSNLTALSALTAPAAITASAFAAGTDGAATDAELIAEFDRISTAVGTSFTSFTTSLKAREGRILGRVLFVDGTFPKDFLEWVRTYVPSVAGVTNLDKPTGSATNGLPDALSNAGITVASGAKLVRINIIM